MREPLKVGIWIRVSTDKQVKDESPEHHGQRAKHYIDSKGWKPAKIYRLDGVSGRGIMSHPETQRMLHDIKSGEINGLVFSKLARLARSTKKLLEFADIFSRSKANLISLSENIDTSTPTGMLFFTVISAMAEWEREEISSRVSASIPVRAKLGKPLGGQAVFGYSWHNKQFVINEVEAPVRKLIYEIFLKTMRKKTTADELNRLGYRTHKGALFSDTTVARLLRDTTAKGERIANYSKNTQFGKRTVLKPKNEWITTKCPQIVSEQIWNKANRILIEQESKKICIGRRPAYLQSGIVKCSFSKKMYIKSKRKVYQCKDCRVEVAVNDIDRIFWGFLSDSLNNIDIKELIGDYNILLQKKQILFEETMNEKVLLEKRIQKYMAMRMDNEITREKFIDNLHPLNAQLSNLEGFLQKLRTGIDSEVLKIRSREEQVNEAQLLVKYWPTMTFERKRTIIETITKRVVISEKSIKVEFSINLPNLLGGENNLHSNIPALPCFQQKQRLRKNKTVFIPKIPSFLGGHIKKKRLEQRMYQTDVARLFNVTPDSITYWENNRFEPQVQYYPRIIDFLGYFPFDIDMSTFEGKVKAYRYRNGLSQKYFAKLMNVDPATVARWEEGKGSGTKRKEIEAKLSNYDFVKIKTMQET